ncbi:MAG: hypothetical protein Q9191_005702 [Dirinaria sp. TL-2023a]
MSSKKRKRTGGVEHNNNGLDTSKPTAVFKPTGGRAYTLSIALPGSIIANAQSPDLKAQLAGQIARALAVFCVDEIVIFDDGHTPTQNSYRGGAPSGGRNEDYYTGYNDPSYFLMHLLSYLETPPHLRQRLFPMHPDLQKAGALPSLDMPHHMRPQEWCQYREGITLESQSANGAEGGTEEKSKKKKKRKSDSEASQPRTLVDAGLERAVTVHSSIPPHTRVTLRFPDSAGQGDSGGDLVADAVAPSAPREEAGYYWGYSVRAASSLSAVLTECTFDGGYDLTVGTSERGAPVSSLQNSAHGQGSVPEYDHMLIVFGGVAGLEAAVKVDPELEKLGVADPSGLFDCWINLCPEQGSRTIRTEEAVWLGLMGLRDIVVTKGRRKSYAVA